MFWGSTWRSSPPKNPHSPAEARPTKRRASFVLLAPCNLLLHRRYTPAMKIGAHVRSGGGVDSAIDRAVDMGAETIQLFSGSPQAWRRKNYTVKEVDAFKQKTADTCIEPAFIHGLYL